MKTLSLTIAIILSHTLLFAQCPQGAITIISSQADIDNFPVNYPNCTELDGGLTITGGNIVNLYGLSQLTSIGGDLNFLYTVQLSSLAGMDGLTAVGGNLSLTENYTLTSTMGLNNLETIGGYLVIYKNNFIPNLAGFSSLVSVGNDVAIGYNTGLTSFSGLENLTSVGNVFDIDHNPVLSSISGLESLATVGGYLAIQYCDVLSSVDGLEALTSVGGDLSIHNNSAISSVAGLESLTSIGGEFSIRNNPELTSLAGLDNIEANSITDLKIYSNTMLSTCEVLSVCNYLGSPNGVVLINNNASGCNSLQELEEACVWVSLDEFDESQSISIYPNPASSTITIERSGTHSSEARLIISNTCGQQVIMQKIKDKKLTLDISDLPAGIYIVMVFDEDMVVVEKLVKE